MIGEIHSKERDEFPRRIDDLGLHDAVILPGALTDRRELSRYYQLSDAVLFPSQYEQFGIVAIEAAASGRPLLGTPVGIMQTLVPKYNWVSSTPSATSTNSSEISSRCWTHRATGKTLSPIVTRF